MVRVPQELPYYVSHSATNKRDIAVQIGTNVASQQMQTKLHRWQVAFTLDPVFFVASHYGIASPLPALLYRSLLR